MSERLIILDNELQQVKIQNIKQMLLLEKIYKSLPSSGSVASTSADKNEENVLLPECSLPLANVEDVSKLNKNLITNTSFKEAFVSDLNLII